MQNFLPSKYGCVKKMTNIRYGTVLLMLLAEMEKVASVLVLFFPQLCYFLVSVRAKYAKLDHPAQIIAMLIFRIVHCCANF